MQIDLNKAKQPLITPTTTRRVSKYKCYPPRAVVSVPQLFNETFLSTAAEET